MRMNHCDIIIVGRGAGGGIVALKLARSGKHIMVAASIQPAILPTKEKI